MRIQLSRQRGLARKISILSLAVATVTGAMTSAQAISSTTFVAAFGASDNTTTISQVTGEIQTSLQANPNLLLGTSANGKSSLWDAQLAGDVRGLLLRAANGNVTLLPSALLDSDNSYYPTDSGVVIKNSDSFSYLSAASATSGTSASSLGTIPSAVDGYDRTVSAIAAVDGGVYVATIDSEVGQTDAALGVSHVWFLNGATKPVESYTSTGTYIDAIAINPNNAATGQVILVDLTGDSATSGSVSISISNDSKLALTATPTGTAISPDVLDSYLAWGSIAGTPTPLTVQVTEDATNVYSAAGVLLADFPAGVSVSVVPSASALELTGTFANKLTPVVKITPIAVANYAYNSKVQVAATAAYSGFGYTTADIVPTISLVSGKVITPLTSAGAQVKSNFCISFSANAAFALNQLNQSVCSTVSHLLTVSAKKRVVSIVTTGTAITVEKQTISKKKITWAKFKIKIKVVKGKAKVTFKTGGVFRFTAAATATNSVAVSKNLTIK